MRATLRGSAASAACAFVTASVSGSERYSTPAGDRYWTDCAPVWTCAERRTKRDRGAEESDAETTMWHATSYGGDLDDRRRQ